MDASCTIQDGIHVFSLVHKYVSSILGTYQCSGRGSFLQVNMLYSFAFHGKRYVITLLKSDRRTRLASLK